LVAAEAAGADSTSDAMTADTRTITRRMGSPT
jgi:hypothetical protein